MNIKCSVNKHGLWLSCSLKERKLLIEKLETVRTGRLEAEITSRQLRNGLQK